MTYSHDLSKMAIMTIKDDQGLSRTDGMVVYMVWLGLVLDGMVWCSLVLRGGGDLPVMDSHG